MFDQIEPADLKHLSTASLVVNALASRTISEAIEAFCNPDEVRNVCRKTFNLLVDKMPSDCLDLYEAMTVNILACAIDANFNIIGMMESQKRVTAIFEAELKKRNEDAPT